MLYKLFTLFCGCWSSTKCKYFKLSCKVRKATQLMLKWHIGIPLLITALHTLHKPRYSLLQYLLHRCFFLRQVTGSKLIFGHNRSMAGP